MKNITQNVFVLMLLSSILFFSACSTVEKNYVFGVDDVIITQEGRLKNNVKSKTEFVSIAYNDIFGKPLTGSQLEILTLAYESYGDNKFTEDLIVRNFLNSPDVEITPLAEMRADVPKFVKACYRKFFSRDPNEFELWYMVREIESDPAYTPELVYYALMTSNEYRFY